MILDIRCFFVDMVVKQSETCFWCMIMSPCYPSIQQNLDKDHYYLIHTWNSRSWCFDHPSLFFIGHIGHLFISTPNDFSPPKHVVKITFHAASGGEGWEEQAENWQGKNVENRAKSSIIKYHPFLGKLNFMQLLRVIFVRRFPENNSALIGVGTIMISVHVETFWWFCFGRRGKWWKSILC